MGQKGFARTIEDRINVGGVWLLAISVEIQASVVRGSSGSWWRGTCVALKGKGNALSAISSEGMDK